MRINSRLIDIRLRASSSPQEDKFSVLQRTRILGEHKREDQKVEGTHVSRDMGVGSVCACPIHDACVSANQPAGTLLKMTSHTHLLTYTLHTVALSKLDLV